MSSLCSMKRWKFKKLYFNWRWKKNEIKLSSEWTAACVFEDTESVLTEINPQKDHRSSQTKQVTDSIENRVWNARKIDLNFMLFSSSSYYLLATSNSIYRYFIWMHIHASILNYISIPYSFNLTELHIIILIMMIRNKVN